MSDEDPPFEWHVIMDDGYEVGKLGIYSRTASNLGVEGHVVEECNSDGDAVSTVEVFTASVQRKAGGACVDISLNGSMHFCSREQASVIGCLIDKLWDLA